MYKFAKTHVIPPYLEAEVEKLLDGRTRDIKLSREMQRLYRESSWEQRGKIARSWMIWTTLINLFGIPFNHLMIPDALNIILVSGLILFPAINGWAYLVWLRPRTAWVEGLSIVIVMAVAMIGFGALGMAGNDADAERYATQALFVTIVAVGVFAVDLIWSVAIAITSWAIFVGILALNPTINLAELTGIAVFYAMGLTAVVNARNTTSLLAHKTFLMSLRNLYRSAALTEANRLLETLATRDPLTGLVNRRSAADHIETIWNDGAIAKSAVAFVMVDIDHFKKLNDTAGHGAGDACLQRVAASIEASVRSGIDLVSRHGGEEFLIVLNGVTPETAWTLAERIRCGVEALAIRNSGLDPVNDPPGLVTVSVGVAFGADGIAPDTVAKRADDALYDAKHSGRNRVFMATDTEPVLIPVALEVSSLP